MFNISTSFQLTSPRKYTVMISSILILLGFVILIYGANILVDGASALATRFNVPNIVIGLTIVAFGTSAPELVVNGFASVNGNSAIVIGNVIGSNIFNIALILGISAIVFPLTVKTNTTWIEIPLALLAAIIVLVIANDTILNHASTNVITRSEGIILLFFFLIFIAYNFHLMKSGESSESTEVKDYSKLKSILIIVGGLILLIVGGKIIVTHAVKIAQIFGLSERIIALTIVSAGTSLPELATSIIAVRKKNVDIAIGNVVGSNIFNIFLILGFSATISEVPVLLSNQFDLIANIFFSILLFLFIFTGKGRRLEKWEGIVLLTCYACYLYFLLISH